MKLNAVGVSSTNMQKTIEFYGLIGFDFEGVELGADHVEAKPQESGMRLMIDTHELTTKLIGAEPFPSNHSAFALEFDNKSEIDDVVTKLKDREFKVVNEPWDAPWGQYYCVVEDPDGYKVDLYANN